MGQALRALQSRRGAAVLTLLALAVAAIDQGVKAAVAARIPLGASLPVLPDVFYLTHVTNPGVAFGLFQQAGGIRAFASALTAILLLLYTRDRWRHSPLSRLGLAVMLGGAAGNLIDRLRFGHVIDYLDFRVWPVFNLADVAIVVGGGCLFYTLIFRTRGRQPDA
ncbi:MAG: signal peptidase II [Armatimonadetes bacterium]|nr:signal peptidase II [Armatimonadota bacterium]